MKRYSLSLLLIAGYFLVTPQPLHAGFWEWFFTPRKTETSSNSQPTAPATPVCEQTPATPPYSVDQFLADSKTQSLEAAYKLLCGLQQENTKLTLQKAKAKEKQARLKKRKDFYKTSFGLLLQSVNKGLNSEEYENKLMNEWLPTLKTPETRDKVVEYIEQEITQLRERALAAEFLLSRRLSAEEMANFRNALETRAPYLLPIISARRP